MHCEPATILSEVKGNRDTVFEKIKLSRLMKSHRFVSAASR